MEPVTTAGRLDPLLHPFVEAKTPREIKRCRDELYEGHANEVIRAVIQRKLKIAPVRLGDSAKTRDEIEAENIQSDAQINLGVRLNNLRESPEDTISDFLGYTATIALNECNALLRRKYPKRHLVKNQLRYICSRNTGLTLWRSACGDGWETACGFDAWRIEKRRVERNTRYLEMTANPGLFARSALSSQDAVDAHPGILVAGLLDRVGGPIDLDDLVEVVADVFGIKDTPPIDSYVDPDGPTSPGRGGGLSTVIVRRAYLQKLWEQIRELPQRQRAAVLLNLRDQQGGGVIALLPITGTASIRQIAAAINLPFIDMVELWNRLPLDDNSIAEQLGVTRQQVINLRKVARERLGRRLAGWDANAAD